MVRHVAHYNNRTPEIHINLLCSNIHSLKKNDVNNSGGWVGPFFKCGRKLIKGSVGPKIGVFVNVIYGQPLISLRGLSTL